MVCIPGTPRYNCTVPVSAPVLYDIIGYNLYYWLYGPGVISETDPPPPVPTYHAWRARRRCPGVHCSPRACGARLIHTEHNHT